MVSGPSNENSLAVKLTMLGVAADAGVDAAAAAFEAVSVV
jgi:hypothetical protein